jgi:hypothetical protein
VPVIVTMRHEQKKQKLVIAVASSMKAPKIFHWEVGGGEVDTEAIKFIIHNLYYYIYIIHFSG